MGIKHAFTSAKSDGGDTSLVRPSNWNADHVGLYPVLIQSAWNEVSGGSLGLTLGSTPTNGQRIILGVWKTSNDITGVTQTGVTWTKIRETNYSTTTYGDIWVGVVGSGASTSITVTGGSGGFMGATCAVIADTLTPTELSGTSVANIDSQITDTTYCEVDVTSYQGKFWVAFAGQTDGTKEVALGCSQPFVTVKFSRIPLLIGYIVATGKLATWFIYGTSGSDFVNLLSIIE